MPILYGMDKKGIILTLNEREPAHCHQCRGGGSEEDLFSCSRCGTPAIVLTEGGWCSDCKGYLAQMSKDD